MILFCHCGAQLEVDDSFTRDEALREARLAEAETWSSEHRGSGHGLYFNSPGFGSGGNPAPSPRKDS
jgi:hypothetical protein